MIDSDTVEDCLYGAARQYAFTVRNEPLRVLSVRTNELAHDQRQQSAPIFNLPGPPMDWDELYREIAGSA